MSIFGNYMFTQKQQQQLLERVLEPSGMTIDGLAQRMVGYIRIHLLSASVLATDRPRMMQLKANLLDPEIEPEIVTMEIGEFSLQTSAVPLPEHRHPDESFEDHFWRTTYTVDSSRLLAQYMIDPPLRAMPDARRAYIRRLAQLKDLMIRKEFPGRFENARKVAEVALGKPPGRASVVVFRPLSPTAALRPITHERASSLVQDTKKASVLQLRLAVDYDGRCEEDDIDPRLWTVAAVNYHLLTYSVVFAESQTEMEVTQEELLRLFIDSEEII
ncbi:hypothetical protein CERSUDRAFT_93515 [Gelatoporia subvermispora B]|uniref:Uncharacterized protein n=1 Tax=Ceriporiopsis subvermispora (strain B) TaxID=914234 RepID=M2R0G5_CERS8|nr:hypothetical protein CERSUDRAFT_93515 [Gelatoporia subvermispora B]